MSMRIIMTIRILMRIIRLTHGLSINTIRSKSERIGTLTSVNVSVSVRIRISDV